MFRYETKNQPLANRRRFVQRLAANFSLVLGLIVVSLCAGMAGYHWSEGMGWLDSFVNAAMILGGMGPVNELKTGAGKLFAGFYALYCGIFLIVAAGLLLSPLLHRIMHGLHAVSDDTKAATGKSSR